MDRERTVPSGFDRRTLLRAMAASLALAAAAGRRAKADERALPYVNAPEFVVPGKPKLYATAVRFAGYAQPVLGKTQVGRPVKLEGNPDHPASGGATDAFTQAALLGLYDPQRSQRPLRRGQPTSWAAFDTAMQQRRRLLDGRQGEGFRLLTGAVTSPTMLRQIATLLARWPGARWHVHEPIADDSAVEGARLVFGQPLQPHLRLDKADIVVCLGDDPLGPGPRQTLHVRRWSVRRRAFQAGDGGSRLFVAEPTPSLTGARADERLVVPSHRLPALAAALATGLGLPVAIVALTPREQAWVDAALAALAAAKGRALLTVGDRQSSDLHGLAVLINQRLDALGATLVFSEPIVARPSPAGASLQTLVADIAQGAVSTVLVLEANPVATAPGDLDVAGALADVDLVVHAGLYVDETAALSHWHVPLEHDLETWSDARAVDGTMGIVQPLIRPFFSVRSAHRLLDQWRGRTMPGYDIVRETWRERWGAGFDGEWYDALLRGFVADSAAAAIAPLVAAPAVTPAQEPPSGGLAVEIEPDPTIWDGRLAHNAWLQETPKPHTKVTWGNVILLGPRLAQARGFAAGDEVRLEVGGRSLVGAAWPQPGQDEGTVTLSLGYGRRAGGVVPDGYDAYALSLTSAPWRRGGGTLTATGKRQTVACTQAVQAMDGFDFVRTVDSPGAATPSSKPAATFFPVPPPASPSWGMTVDVDLCIGCNACVVACGAENNVPVVGKELVAQGRFMHWLRVDHYHAGDSAAPDLYFQPVPCMHCEEAPCEMGCPVNAAVHSSDGLNLQVYNRCIGTRTCSAYCPYKVRRFNWFDYTSDDPDSLKAMRNPEVTVRSRGVMEKCTYCVQRISAARIAAKLAGRPIGEGDVVTACQQVCPSQAITFGDVAKPDSAVAQRKASPRNYTLVEEANTRPRTTYLARIGKGRGR